MRRGCGKPPSIGGKIWRQAGERAHICRSPFTPASRGAERLRAGGLLSRATTTPQNAGLLESPIEGMLVQKWSKPSPPSRGQAMLPTWQGDRCAYRWVTIRNNADCYPCASLLNAKVPYSTSSRLLSF